jgi:large repetitive protein
MPPVPAVVTAGRTTDVPFTAGAPGSILLTIRDKATGVSIGNKVLTVTATPTTQGAPVQGVPTGDKWQVLNLTAGSYVVAVAATGYTTPAPVTIAVAAGQQAALTVELDAIPVNDAVINLEVSDKTTGARIDQAVQSVKATNVATGAVKTGTKGGASGLWSITQLAAGTYSVEVTATNYQKETVASVALTSSQVKTQTVQMTATPGTVALNVTNATTGAAIDDKVTAVTATLGTSSFNGVKSGGKWSVTSLPPGTYTVQVTAADFTTKNTTGVVVQAGQTNTLAVALQPVAAPPGSVNLTVTDELTGANIDDKVTSVSATSGTLTFPGTKVSGKWTITNLPPAIYLLAVAATNYNTKTGIGVAVGSGAVQAVTVALQPQPGSIVLTATDSATSANIDDKVSGFTATSPTTGQSFFGTKVSGKWTITNVPPGTYTVAVLASNYNTKTVASVVVAAATANALPVSLVAVLGSMRLTITDAVTGANIDNTVTNATATNAQGQTFPGTKVSGKWTIPNLAPGTYSVATTAPGYDAKTVTGIQVASAAEATPSVQMTPTRGTVTLTLQRLLLAAVSNSFRATVSAPGNQSLTADFVNDQCTISSVNPGPLTITVSRIGGSYPNTVFSLTLPPGGTASKTFKLTSLLRFFSRTNVGAFEHEVISPEVLVSFPGTTPQAPETEAQEWLNVWRDWVALTRPDMGISSGTNARVIVTRTSRPSIEDTVFEGVAVFSSAGGGVVAAIAWNKTVTTSPGL